MSISHIQSHYHQICFIMNFNEFSSLRGFKGVILIFNFSANFCYYVTFKQSDPNGIRVYKLTDIICPVYEKDSYYTTLLSICLSNPIKIKLSPVLTASVVYWLAC
jgi:hypothetical protein